MQRKWIIRGTAGILLLFVVYLAYVLTVGTWTEYEGVDREAMPLLQESSQERLSDSVVSVAIWNLGYGGLGAESDFFYESNSWVSGGRMIRPSRDLVDKNINGMEQFMRQTEADFFLFQEVDRASRRSYYSDILDSVRLQKAGFYAGYAVNYRVQRVPVPLLEPWRAYGRVESGLATVARYQPSSSLRLQLPGAFSWPTRIFSLDRCAAVHRFPTAKGNELVLINVHNSAYDDGSLKQQQMAFLKELFLEEYEKGNYVIAGGDWNQCPPYFRFDGFMPGQSGSYLQENIPADFLPADWQWVYDPTQPTNRKINEPFQPGETFVTLIDFFLISPNLQVLQVKGLPQGFRYSDHQPVWMEVALQ